MANVQSGAGPRPDTPIGAIPSSNTAPDGPISANPAPVWPHTLGRSHPDTLNDRVVSSTGPDVAASSPAARIARALPITPRVQPAPPSSVSVGPPRAADAEYPVLSSNA